MSARKWEDTCIQDALLDEEGAQPDNAFGGGANAVSLKVPAAQARQSERILSAQEAHEVCESSALLYQQE